MKENKKMNKNDKNRIGLYHLASREKVFFSEF